MHPTRRVIANEGVKDISGRRGEEDQLTENSPAPDGQGTYPKCTDTETFFFT